MCKQHQLICEKAIAPVVSRQRQVCVSHFESAPIRVDTLFNRVGEAELASALNASNIYPQVTNRLRPFQHRIHYKIHIHLCTAPIL